MDMREYFRSLVSMTLVALAALVVFAGLFLLVSVTIIKPWAGVPAVLAVMAYIHAFTDRIGNGFRRVVAFHDRIVDLIPS
jgi:hypothetical protein